MWITVSNYCCAPVYISPGFYCYSNGWPLYATPVQLLIPPCILECVVISILFSFPWQWNIAMVTGRISVPASVVGNVTRHVAEECAANRTSVAGRERSETEKEQISETGRLHEQRLTVTIFIFVWFIRLWQLGGFLVNFIDLVTHSYGSKMASHYDVEHRTGRAEKPCGFSLIGYRFESSGRDFHLTPNCSHTALLGLAQSTHWASLARKRSLTQIVVFHCPWCHTPPCSPQSLFLAKLEKKKTTHKSMFD